MSVDTLCRTLLECEADAVTRLMAFMSYNPSIGRVLEKDGVKKFETIALRLVGRLHAVQTQPQFDRLHARSVHAIVTKLRTSRGKKVSYGQAAKPINVFLKVYVDWAGSPGRAVRLRLLPFLHVPLDSVLMQEIRHDAPDWYQKEIAPSLKNKANRYSLTHIDRRLYWRWQTYFRTRWPRKPLLFDIAWAMHRDGLGS